MKLKFFNTDDKTAEQELMRLEKAIFSPVFLSGLVSGSELNSLANSFILVTDITECAKRISWSDGVYDLPEPWPYQHFGELIEYEGGRLICGTLPHKEMVIRKKEIIAPNKKIWDDVSFEIIEERYQALFVDTYLEFISEEEKQDINLLKWIYHDEFKTLIDETIALLIEAACTVGFEKSPICLRLLETFEAGGVPAGWVGETPRNGGEAKDCLQLFHLGK